ncbi:DUF4942 domain-containing protein [Photorhabdus akhurstii]|uniref:DUF4942 domain-containing protein n=1 Tax=Photorhabdus akhurstii TaxID=171438 RepID=UPI002022F6D0|nr:DUF4942 domain-containing protein [Photorhabdus akhurstii]
MRLPLKTLLVPVLALATTAQAIPNMLSSGFGLGVTEYLITNQQNVVFSLNCTTNPDAQNVLLHSVLIDQPGGNRVDSRDEQTSITVVMDDQPHLTTGLHHMQNLPFPEPRAAQLGPSPVQVWQLLLTHLLDKQYGLTLNDTPFGDDSVIQAHINAGISLCDAVMPTISESNILSTFEQLHQSKAEVFERGIINVFRGLSWDYKTNSPCFLGKKIIINNLVTHSRWGFSLTWGFRRDQLVDLERMLFLLDGKSIPDNRADISINLMNHIRDNPGKDVYDDTYFSIRYFQKGTAHLTFKRPELVEKMNDIIAKHYPNQLLLTSIVR